MSGNEMEAHLGVAMAAMDSAKVRLLSLFDLTYPHMLDDQERKTWTAGLFLAQNSLTQARNELNHAIGAPMLGLPPDAFAHFSEQPGPLVNPTPQECPLCKPCRSLLKEAFVALKLAYPTIDSDLSRTLDLTINRIAEFFNGIGGHSEEGLGENLGSTVPKGSDTETYSDFVLANSLLQTLRDIKTEVDDQRHDAHSRLTRIQILVSDVLAKEGRNA